MKKTKTINILDLLLLITILLSISGYLFAKANKTPLNKIIEGKEKIAIEILLPDVFTKNDFIKVGKETAITIRNRPYTKLTIIRSESKQKQIVIPAYSGSYKTIVDPTKSNVKDYFITLSDFALITKDGYVIGGNKIKIGNQVELEGFNYRLTGKVINIYPAKEN